jgi:hypothetical protein
MGKLINHANAYISLEKLTAYCLNEFHPHGKEKAIVFKTVLGIGINEASILKEAILKGLSENDSIAKGQDEYGKRFSVLMKVSIFQKEAIINTGWIFRSGEDYPRLTTCYIKRGRK